MPTNRENTWGSAAPPCRGCNQNGQNSRAWRPAFGGRNPDRWRQERRIAVDGGGHADRGPRRAVQRAEARRYRDDDAAAVATRHRRGADEQRWAHVVDRRLDQQTPGA